jgi:molybdenum cofactor cytidylyltransferase
MNSVSFPKLSILILAAGFSSRMGEPKALARVRGISLLRKTIELAASLESARIVAVVPHRAARYRPEARGTKAIFIANAQRAQGLSSSIRRGIRALRYSPAVLLLPVDLAVLRRRDLAKLMSRWRAAPRCVIARRIGLTGGIPLILPRRLYRRALCLMGDAGLRDLVSELPHEIRLVDLPSAAWDIDTQQDLKAARRLFKAGD